MSVNLGNYFEDCSRTDLIQNQKTLTSTTLSKIIRSGQMKVIFLKPLKKQKP